MEGTAFFCGFFVAIIISGLFFMDSSIVYDTRVTPYAQSLCEAHEIKEIKSRRMVGTGSIDYTLSCSNGAVFKFATDNIK